MREISSNPYSPSSISPMGVISAYSEQLFNFGTIPGSIMTLDTQARGDARRRKDLHIRDVPCPFSISPKVGDIWRNFSFWRHSLVDYDPGGAAGSHRVQIRTADSDSTTKITLWCQLSYEWMNVVECTTDKLVADVNKVTWRITGFYDNNYPRVPTFIWMNEWICRMRHVERVADVYYRGQSS